MEGLTPVGACRLCVVEVSGVGRMLPSCTTPVQEGMAVRTDSEKLKGYRRIALELLFTERNHYCSICVSNGHCELQGLAQKLGVTGVRYPYAYPKLAGGRFAPALRARPQPLHPLYALRAGVQRSGGRARVGCHVARRAIQAGVRDGEALGARPKAAPVAASACRLVLPARWRRRDGRSRRWPRAIPTSAAWQSIGERIDEQD